MTCSITSPIGTHVAMRKTMAVEAFQVRSDLFQKQKSLFEAQARVKLIAWHGCEPGESVKAAIRRVVNATGLPQSKITKAWYGLPQRIDAWVLDILRAKTGNVRDAEKQLPELRRRHFPTVESSDQLHLGLDRLPPHHCG